MVALIDSLVFSLVGESTSSTTTGGGGMTTINTQPNSTPSATTITLGEGEDGLSIWMGDSIDLDAHPEARAYVYIDDGTVVHKCDLIWGQCYFFKASEFGARLRIGSTYLDGTGVSLALTVSPFSVPVDFVNPSDSAIMVTGNVNCDGNYPAEWEPTVKRITLPQDCMSFTIDFTGTDVHTVYYIKERPHSGADWSPFRAVIVRPDTKTRVFCRYREIAAMISQQEAGCIMPVECPTGSTVDTATASTMLDITAAFGTPDSTATVSNAAELATELGNMVAGTSKKITLNSGTYTTASIVIASLTNDLWLASATGDPADVLFSNVDVDITCDTVSRKLTISGITFDMHGGNMFRINKGDVNVSLCDFTKDAGTGTDDVIYCDAVATDSTFKFAFCNATGHATAAFDVWSNTSSGSAADNANTILIGCTGSTPGDTGQGGGTNCNLATQHVGHKMWIWGGSYTDPANISGAGPTIAPDVDGNMWLIGVQVNDGATTNAVRYGAGSAPIKLSYGCDVADIGDDASCIEVINAICNRFVMGGANTNFFSSNGTTFTYRLIGNTFANTGNVGICLYVAMGAYEIVGNSFTGFATSYYIAGSNSSQSPQMIAFNYDVNPGTAVDVGRGTQTGIISILFNTTRGTVSSAVSSTKNAKVDGNLNTNSGAMSSQLVQTANRSTITPTLNSSAATNTNLDADLTPQSTSNLDWETYASALSAGNKTTLRERYDTDLGLIGPKGDCILIDPTFCCRGPRQREVIPSGSGLFQGIR